MSCRRWLWVVCLTACTDRDSPEQDQAGGTAVCEQACELQIECLANPDSYPDDHCERSCMGILGGAGGCGAEAEAWNACMAVLTCAQIEEFMRDPNDSVCLDPYLEWVDC